MFLLFSCFCDIKAEGRIFLYHEPHTADSLFLIWLPDRYQNNIRPKEHLRTETYALRYPHSFCGIHCSVVFLSVENAEEFPPGRFLIWRPARTRNTDAPYAPRYAAAPVLSFIIQKSEEKTSPEIMKKVLSSLHLTPICYTIQ